MDIRKSLFLIVCSLVAIASSGCAMKGETFENIEPEKIQTIQPGENVTIHLNKRVLIEDREVFIAELIVIDANAERIHGEYTFYDFDSKKYRTEIFFKVEDINFVSVVKEERGIDWEESNSLDEPDFWGSIAGFLLALFILGVL